MIKNIIKSIAKILLLVVGILFMLLALSMTTYNLFYNMDPVIMYLMQGIQPISLRACIGFAVVGLLFIELSDMKALSKKKAQEINKC